MARVTLPPGCMGIELPGGRKLDGRRGVLTISDEEARLIARSPAARQDLIGRPNTFTFGGTGMSCPRCHRTAWDWERVCPRCGTPLEEHDGKTP